MGKGVLETHSWGARGLQGPEGKTAELTVLFSGQERVRHCHWSGKFWVGDEAGDGNAEGGRGRAPSPALLGPADQGQEVLEVKS